MPRLLSYLSALGVGLLAGLTGCGNSEGRVPLCRTTGQAYFAGKPAQGAMLVFHPLNPSRLPLPPRARVGDDGRFTVETYDANDGLPAGDYVVTVEWRLGGEEETGGDGRSIVPGKYTRKETSDLRVSVSRTGDGLCTLPPIKIAK